MAENQTQIVKSDESNESEKQPSLFTRIRTEHPRKVKAAVITTVLLTAGAIGVAVGAKAGSDSSEDSTDETTESDLATDTDTGSEA